MSEQDFREALRKTMDAVSPPPQMSDATVLAAAHRDRRRRRTLWASAGTAVVVAAIAVGVVLIAPSKSGGDGVQVGGPQPKSTEEVPPPRATGSATEETNVPEESDDTLPPGMTDRTQQSGPEHERGVTLAGALDEVMASAGYGTPGDLKGTGELAGAQLKRDQANYDGKVDGVEKWTYTAITPVTKGDGVGEVFVDVTKTSEQGSGCDLVGSSELGGRCEEITVDGKKVGFVDVDDSIHEHVDQFAVYRHDDGTIVNISQSLDFGFTDLPALSKLPFTPDQLAALTLDPRFKITG